MSGACASRGSAKTDRVSAPALVDSRRLTGPNLISDSPGAVIDVTLAGVPAGRVIDAWREKARLVLGAVGWPDASTSAREFPGGASLVIDAPIDALYAATEVNEWAWAAAEADLAGTPAPDLDIEAERLRGVIAAERDPRLIALRDAALERGVCFLSDDELASVGMGCGSLTWPVESLPDPSQVPWDEVRDVPAALVTGSNGKTTTVRLLAAVASAAGLTAGYSSTDGIYIGSELIDADDWSGPGGGRRVLRDRRVEIAILETARGGILRRGLPVPRTAAAIVTNVAADHLGEFGVHDVEAIADAKLVVAKAAGKSDRLVLNADDPVLAGRARELGLAPTWFAIERGDPAVEAHIEAGGSACMVEDDSFVLILAGRGEQVAAVAEVPIAFGGRARYNVHNALGAAAVAHALGLGTDAIRSGLRDFAGSPDQNPGRGNVFDLSGVKVLVDFAHNPHGLQALGEMAAALPAKRRLLILGQAGDRDDESIRELARVAARLPFDRIIIKEVQKYLRGRSEGEVPTIIAEALRAEGVAAANISRAASELEAVREGLEWASTGDLLILPIHSHREEVLSLLSRLLEEGWVPGRPLPH